MIFNRLTGGQVCTEHPYRKFGPGARNGVPF